MTPHVTSQSPKEISSTAPRRAFTVGAKIGRPLGLETPTSREALLPDVTLGCLRHTCPTMLRSHDAFGGLIASARGVAQLKQSRLCL